MKTQITLFLTIIFFPFFLQAQVDYVELVIPEELKDNPKAVEYLKNDVEQLNKLFHSIDDLATDLEDLALIISKVDTNNVAEIEKVKPEINSKLTSMSGSFLTLSWRLMWYIGKDIMADEEATKGIIEKLDTDEGIAFKKSMKHIKMKKGLLEQRAKEFEKKLDALDF